MFGAGGKAKPNAVIGGKKRKRGKRKKRRRKKKKGKKTENKRVEETGARGKTFVTRTAGKEEHMCVDGCSQCHTFYTGKQKILDNGGRVARFEKRYGKKSK